MNLRYGEVKRMNKKQNGGELERQSAEKTLLREIETAYLDAVSAQSQYLAAAEKLRDVYKRQFVVTL